MQPYSIYAPSVYEMIINATSDKIFSIDMEWRVVSWNSTLARDTGIATEKAKGAPLLSLFPFTEKDEPLRKAIETALSGETAFLSSGGDVASRNAYECHALPLKNLEERVEGAVVIMHDVSHRMEAENKLRQLNDDLNDKCSELEKISRELSAFTLITTSELQHPIRNIYTGLELVIKSEGRKLSDGSKANFRRMQSSLTRMNLLLDDLTQLAEAGNVLKEKKFFALAPVVEKTLERLQKKTEEKKAAITTEIIPEIFASPEMVEQLLYHLLDNALKFSRPSLPPVISLKVSLQTEEGKKYARVAVSDNGQGLPPEEIPRIFNMFVQYPYDPRPAGTGIGLSLSEKIAQAHQGWITVDTTPEVGSTFTCYLLQSS